MTNREAWESEDALAAAANLPAYDAVKREALLALTTRAIRARRRRGVVLQAAALVLAFISGMAAMNQFRAPTAEVAERDSTTAGTLLSDAQSRQPVADDSAVLDDPEALAHAYDAATPDQRLALLKRAGDHALNDRGNLRDALVYYRQWLRLADPPTREQFDDSDSWLLASLKQDQ